VFAYQIKLHNTQRTPQEIIMLDQLPISESDKIEVELIEPKVKEGSVRITQQRFVEWQLKLEPQQELVVNFTFAVEYPKEMYINGVD
jgi:hypothetical protein